MGCEGSGPKDVAHGQGGNGCWGLRGEVLTSKPNPEKGFGGHKKADLGLNEASHHWQRVLGVG